MNITVPANVVTNDQVKRTIASGCNIMKMPAAMMAHARASMGPRRSALGQDEREAGFTCAPPRR